MRDGVWIVCYHLHYYLSEVERLIDNIHHFVISMLYRNMINTAMRLDEILLAEKSLNKPLVVVDVQPAYSGIMDGVDDAHFEEIIQFVSSTRGPVLMFVNAEQDGLTSDTVQDVKVYWEDSGFDPAQWSRVKIVDKGYGYLRSWMDQGVHPRIIIQTTREMYRQKVYDSRQLFNGDEDELLAFVKNICNGRLYAYCPAPSVITGDSISVGWAAIDQLRRFNDCYICGGGANECLREVTILMNAFNIKYTVLQDYVYGGVYTQT